MKVFYLGANIYEESVDLIEESNGAMLIYERYDTLPIRERIDKFHQLGKAYRIDGSTRQVSQGDVFVGNPHDHREIILKSVLNDYRVFLLRTRFKRFDFAGAYAALSEFTEVIDRALEFFGAHKKMQVFCMYTPHTLASWLFIRTLEEAGAQIVRLVMTPLPWVFMPISGLKNERVDGLATYSNKSERSKLEKYVSLLEGKYTDAVPYYEKISRKRVRSIITIASLAKNVEKYLIKREYTNEVRGLNPEMPYAVYFLHYQPESNTLPEAEIYCDQYQAIKKLADALPSGVELAVKEHPSTFSKRCDRRWRPKGFYSRIASLKNVRVCSNAVDTFSLIDGSIFVASIAGVCLTEALARGKVAVTFYSPRFRYFSDDLVIDANLAQPSDLRLAFSEIASGNRAYGGKDALIRCMEDTSKHAYDGSIGESIAPRSASEQYEIGRRINIRFIEDAIGNKLQHIRSSNATSAT